VLTLLFDLRAPFLELPCRLRRPSFLPLISLRFAVPKIDPALLENIDLSLFFCRRIALPFQKRRSAAAIASRNPYPRDNPPLLRGFVSCLLCVPRSNLYINGLLGPHSFPDGIILFAVLSLVGPSCPVQSGSFPPPSPGTACGSLRVVSSPHPQVGEEYLVPSAAVRFHGV